MGADDVNDRSAGGRPAGERKARARVDRRMGEALPAMLAAAGAAALLTMSALGGCGSSGGGGFRAAAVLSPPRPAPALALRNYMGRPVNIDAYRGRAVLVTFIYTHCPDACPLIVSNLRVAQSLMGAKTAAKAQIIAVSVDPRGDTPAAVAAFLRIHGMTGRMQYLIGSTRELGRVWRAWGVGAERDARQPELVNHTGLVYGITAGGMRMTIYASNFKPSDIAHDVPLLASR